LTLLKSPFGATKGNREVLGIGKRKSIDKLEIRWPKPSGRLETFTDLPIDRYITIVEGSGIKRFRRHLIRVWLARPYNSNTMVGKLEVRARHLHLGHVAGYAFNVRHRAFCAG